MKPGYVPLAQGQAWFFCVYRRLAVTCELALRLLYVEGTIMERGDDMIGSTVLVSQGAMLNSAADVKPVRFDAGLTLREIEKEVILETLKRQNYNRTKAARTLGIGIRTLQRKLKMYQTEAAVVA